MQRLKIVSLGLFITISSLSPTLAQTAAGTSQNLPRVQEVRFRCLFDQTLAFGNQIQLLTSKGLDGGAYLRHLEAKTNLTEQQTKQLISIALRVSPGPGGQLTSPTSSSTLAQQFGGPISGQKVNVFTTQLHATLGDAAFQKLNSSLNTTILPDLQIPKSNTDSAVAPADTTDSEEYTYGYLSSNYDATSGLITVYGETNATYMPGLNFYYPAANVIISDPSGQDKSWTGYGSTSSLDGGVTASMPAPASGNYNITLTNYLQASSLQQPCNNANLYCKFVGDGYLDGAYQIVNVIDHGQIIGYYYQIQPPYTITNIPQFIELGTLQDTITVP